MKTYNEAFALTHVFAAEDFQDKVTEVTKGQIEIEWYECQNGLVLLVMLGTTDEEYELDYVIDEMLYAHPLI